MKLQIPMGVLRDALNAAVSTIDKKQVNEDTALVHLQARKTDNEGYLYIYTTNGIEQSFIKRPAEVEEEGEVSVSLDLLSSRMYGEDKQLIRVKHTSPKMVVETLSFDTGKVQSKAQLASSPISSLILQRIKNLPLGEKATAVMSAVSLKEIIERTQAFVLRKDGQEYLMGVLLSSNGNSYEASATNTQVLAKVSVESDRAPEKFRVLIPSRSLGPISRILAKNKDEDIKIIVKLDDDGLARALYLRTNGHFYGTNLPIEKFPSMPAYAQLSTIKGNTISFESGAQLHNVLSQCQAFSQDGFVSLTMGEGRVVVKAGNPKGFVEEDVPAKLVEGSAGVTVGFHVSYLLSVLGPAKAEEVRMTFTPNGQRAFFMTTSECKTHTCYAVAPAIASVAVAA